jgi:hypothetical protein
VRLPAPWRIPELVEEIRARRGEVAAEHTRRDRRSPAASARPGYAHGSTRHSDLPTR